MWLLTGLCELIDNNIAMDNQNPFYFNERVYLK